MMQWVEEIFRHCDTTYTNDDGVLVTSIYVDGSIKDATPMVADYGDLLPFANHFGFESITRHQIERSKSYIQSGLFKYDDKIELFFNHDWLLGLLDLYRQTQDRHFLELAIDGSEFIEKNFFCRDILIDEVADKFSWKNSLAAASPFNGDYVELWVDLYRFTGERKFLALAERAASGWATHRDFLRDGIFCRSHSIRFPIVNALGKKLSTMKSRLFKDNTNTVWSYLELYTETKDVHWRRVIEQWLGGFERSFWNQGKTALMVDYKGLAYNFSLKAAFSSIDLLCDLAYNEIKMADCRRMAEAIASCWLEDQWDNGLFAEVYNGNQSHLDANVDMAVALYKLSYITDKPEYQSAAQQTSKAVIKYHWTENGYCNAVDQAGEIVDTEIKIKYQGLLTKLALLGDDVAEVYQDKNTFDLLRDR